MHFKPLSCSFCNVFFRFCRCSSSVAPPVRMSSRYTTTPGRSLVSLFMISWKYPGAELMPNGCLIWRKTPLGVLRARCYWLSGASPIFECGISAKSIFVKNLLLGNFLIKSSGNGFWCCWVCSCGFTVTAYSPHARNLTFNPIPFFRIGSIHKFGPGSRITIWTVIY